MGSAARRAQRCRVVDIGLHESPPEADARLALFAIRFHCCDDGHAALRSAGQVDPGRALCILRLLKDADALHRVRLGGDADEIDSSALRHDSTRAMVGFAEELLSVMP